MNKTFALRKGWNDRWNGKGLKNNPFVLLERRLERWIKIKPNSLKNKSEQWNDLPGTNAPILRAFRSRR